MKTSNLPREEGRKFTREDVEVFVKLIEEEGARKERARIRRELLEADWPVILGVNRFQHERELREILDRICARAGYDECFCGLERQEGMWNEGYEAGKREGTEAESARLRLLLERCLGVFEDFDAVASSPAAETGRVGPGAAVIRKDLLPDRLPYMVKGFVIDSMEMRAAGALDDGREFQDIRIYLREVEG